MEKVPACVNGFKTVTTFLYKLLLIGPFILILIILSVIYSIIFSIARRHMRQIHDQEAHTSTTSQQAKYKAEVKIAKMLMLVFGMFYIAYLPTIVLIVIPYVFAISANEESI